MLRTFQPGRLVGGYRMRLCKLTVALGVHDQARLAAVLFAVLREELHRQHTEFDSIFERVSPNRADLLHLFQKAHDHGEQADHLLLAIARNEAARHLQREAEDIFDGFRSIEAAVEAALERQRRT